jgi:hypothetical protein
MAVIVLKAHPRQTSHANEMHSMEIMNRREAKVIWMGKK